MDTHTEASSEVIDDLLQSVIWVGLIFSDAEPMSFCETPGPHDDDDISWVTEADRTELATAFAPFYAHAVKLLDEADFDDSIWHNDHGRIAHDWVLTSLGHGTGFWDRYWKDEDAAYCELGEKLTAASKTDMGLVEGGLESPKGWIMY